MGTEPLVWFPSLFSASCMAFPDVGMSTSRHNYSLLWYETYHSREVIKSHTMVSCIAPFIDFPPSLLPLGGRPLEELCHRQQPSLPQDVVNEWPLAHFTLFMRIVSWRKLQESFFGISDFCFPSETFNLFLCCEFPQALPTFSQC